MRAPAVSRPLIAALSTLLPDETRTRLFRAALHEGARQTDAWNEIVSSGVRVEELFRRDIVGLKRVAPLLHLGAGRAQVELPKSLTTVLRTAYVREQLRSGEYGTILRAALESLEVAGVESILLTGAALAHTVYPEPALRHAHDIDFLVRPGRTEAAVQALADAGFGAPQTVELDGGALTEIVHDSLLPALIHERFVRVSCFGPPAHELWEQTAVREVAGTKAHILRPELALLRTLARASFCPHRAGGQWITDAWFLMQAGPLRWDSFTTWAADGGLSAPAFVFLGYLEKEMSAPVPAEVLELLAEATAHTTPLCRDALLYGAGRFGRGPGPLVPLELSFGDRLKLAALRLFPSTDYLRWSSDTEQGTRLGLWSRRVLRAAVGRR